MRIYSNARELMSEMSRDLWEMGTEVKPKTYQNKVIEGNEDFITKEEFCKQYCITNLPDVEYLFVFTNAKKWADMEFKERIGGHPVNPGTAYLERKDMWEQFLDKQGKFDYTYADRINRFVKYKGENLTALEAVIELLKTDPDTRKAVLPIFTGSDCNYYEGNKRIPCSVYYGFFVREGKLNLTYHQRSSDFVQHFGDDVYLAWCMMEYVAEKVGVKPGMLIHTIDSLHCYKKDWHLLKSSIDDLMNDKK